jgi:hypothetical protein
MASPPAYCAFPHDTVAGLNRRMPMKRYALSLITMSLALAVAGNPAIALACNKIIGT